MFIIKEHAAHAPERWSSNIIRFMIIENRVLLNFDRSQ